MIRPKRHCLKFEVSLDARGRGQDTRLNHDFFTWLVQATFEFEFKFEPKFFCVKKWPLFCWMLSWWERISKSECWRRRGSVPHLSCTKTSLSRGLRPIFRLNLGAILTLGYEQFWLQSNFCHRWFFSLSEKEFGHQQGFWAGFMCWGEDLHCFLDRISQASVRFWEWKGNSKEADETKKN